MTSTVRLGSCLPGTVAEISATVEQQRATEERAFRDGFAAGYQDGYEVGYGRAHTEIAEEWHRVYETVQRHARMRTHAELTAIRGEYNDREGARRAA